MRRASFLIIVLVAFVAMTAIVAVRAFLPGDNADFARGERVMPVAVASVPSVEFADVVEALGTARANETVTITARVTDTISRINFESGQRRRDPGRADRYRRGCRSDRSPLHPGRGAARV